MRTAASIQNDFSFYRRTMNRMKVACARVCVCV